MADTIAALDLITLLVRQNCSVVFPQFLQTRMLKCIVDDFSTGLQFDGFGRTLEAALHDAVEKRRQHLTGLESSERKQEPSTDELSDYLEKAYRSFELAESHAGQKLTDNAAYEWLAEHGPPEYTLPKYPSWVRYVRAARRFYDTNKNQPRGGQTSRSAITSDDSSRSRDAD